MHPLIKSHIALFVLNLMYGANYVVAKGLMPNVIGPNGFILLRVGGAAILFWLVFSTKFEKVSKKDLGLLALCALFGVAINQLFFFNGLMRTSPVNASVIMTTSPIMVFILSLILLKEKPNKLKIVGLIVGATGSIVFTLQGNFGGDSSLLGDLFIFMNAASYSLYLVLVKPLMAKYKPLTVVTWVFTFGLIYVLCWPMSSNELITTEFTSISTDAILRLTFVVICVTFLPYLLMVYAMKRVSPAVGSTYIYLQPLMAAFFIYLFWLFGLENYTQDITVGKVLAALLIFLGVYLVIKPNKSVTN
ncbi:MAG: drug/metabolite transporter (DMT)-like permease [Crocinitomix sp.]|jgi:drug/metabolite transporter (DMT)-like permease